MKFNVLNRFGRILMTTAILVSVFGCSDDSGESVDPLIGPILALNADEYLSVVYSSSHTGNTETYVQSWTNLLDRKMSFVGYGFEVPSTRTARVFASTDGKTLYNLDYGGGTIASFRVYGGQSYAEIKKRGMQDAMGTPYPRGTKFSDDNMLIHTVASAKSFIGEGDNKVYDYYKAEAILLDVNLNSELTLGETVKFELIPSVADKAKGLYISRIDAPVVANGKAYYGFNMGYKVPETGENAPDGFVRPEYQSQSLVVDYPSLTSPKIITSTVSKGSTYGYRVPVSHVDEDGNIYQITDTHMLKIDPTTGEYDNSYVFDLSTHGIGARGWFYCGDGIGYATTYDRKKGSSSDAKAWGVTRINIKNKTVVKMNVMGELSLGQYQMAKLGKDGKLYMALSPVGKNGYIHIFDPAIATADGVKLGTQLLNHGNGASYIGVF